MTNEKLYEAIGAISDKYIKEAKCVKRSVHQGLFKWCVAIAAAACLCIAACVAIPVIKYKGNSFQSDPLRPLNVIEYNGAYYEGIDMNDTKTLDIYNLPRKIKPDMVGKILETGVGDNGDQTLYQYVPYADIVTITADLKQERAQRAVYITEANGEYAFALFCNFIGFDSNTHTEVGEMFAVYGVDEALDIASITIGREKIKSSDKIKAVFDNLNASYAMGNDDYQNAVFKGMSEEEQQALSIELADSMIEVKIITVEGLVINNIRYYPTIGYVSWALNYYRLDTPIE